MALDRETIDGYNSTDLNTARFSGWCSDRPYICQPNETRLREVVEGVGWHFPQTGTIHLITQKVSWSSGVVREYSYFCIEVLQEGH